MQKWSKNCVLKPNSSLSLRQEAIQQNNMIAIHGSESVFKSKNDYHGMYFH